MNLSPHQNKIAPLPLPLSSNSYKNHEMSGSAAFRLFEEQLSLTSVSFKLVKESDWSMERALRTEKEYKAFLFLIGTQKKHMFVPSLDIDEMWHTHILDTRKYMADCARHFGEYIHHYPFLGMKDEEDQSRAHNLFATTRQAMSKLLGDEAQNLDLANCGGGGCGGGSSCGGSSSCGGHSSCGGSSHSSCGGGHGHGHGHHSSCTSPSIITPISSCSTSGTESPSRRDRSPSKPTPPSRPTRQPTIERKRGILSRILGLSPTDTETKWYASVTPELFTQDDFRPDADALQNLKTNIRYH